MNLQVVSVEAKIVSPTADARVANTKYVTVELYDADNNMRLSANVFGDEAKPYLDCISTAKNGNATEDKQIPEADTLWKNCVLQPFVFPEPMVLVEENSKETPRKPRLNKYGNKIIKTYVTVLTRYNFDAMRHLISDVNGNPLSDYYPKPGWDVQSRGSSIMAAFYEPESKYAPDAVKITAEQLAHLAEEHAEIPV